MWKLGFLLCGLIAHGAAMPRCAGAEVWEFGSHKEPLAAAGFHLTVWSPTVADANSTLLLFVTGFGATVDANAYSDAMCEVATGGSSSSRGGGNGSSIIVVTADLKNKKAANSALLGAPDYAKLGALLAGTTLPFLRSAAFLGSFSAAAARAGTAVASPDARLSNLAVGGHSAGNHIALRALVGPDMNSSAPSDVSACPGGGGGGYARAAILIDPVDGVDPFGFIKQYVIHPPARLPFAAPALHIETGLDPVSAVLDFPPCAPPKLSNTRFFNAWRGPIWQVNFTKFGHVSLCNGLEGSAAGIICAKPPKGTDEGAFRGAVAAAVRAFLGALFGAAQAGEREAEVAALRSLETPATFAPLDVELQHNYDGHDNLATLYPFCQRSSAHQ